MKNYYKRKLWVKGVVALLLSFLLACNGSNGNGGNGDIDTGKDVVDFGTSPDGNFVAYIADQNTDGVLELFVVELATLEDVHKSLQELRQPTVAKLNAVLNRYSQEILVWPAEHDFKIVQLDRNQVIAELRKMNPQLEAIDFELEAAKHKVELAKKNFWPDIGVGVDWIQTGSAIGSGTSGSGKDPVALMFSVNLPIWRERYKAAQRQAQFNVSRTIQQRTEAENTIVARAVRVLYDFEDSARKISLYQDVLIPKAEELLQASETAYQGATIDFLSLIDAQQTLLKFQLQYERSKTDNKQRLAELEMLVGGQLDAAENPAVGR